MKLGPTCKLLTRRVVRTKTERTLVINDPELEVAIEEWRETKLSPAALARVAIVRRGAVSQDAHVPVRLPNGEVRNMAPGPSSLITKAVLEEFIPRFLVQPGLIWLSESGNQVVAQDDQLARAIGIAIESGPQSARPDPSITTTIHRKRLLSTSSWRPPPALTGLWTCLPRSNFRTRTS